MKKAVPKMLSEFIEELKGVLKSMGDMPVAVTDFDGRFYVADLFIYPQEYYYDGGYIFPIGEEKRATAYEHFASSSLYDENGVDENPLLEYDMVLKIIGGGPDDEETDTLDGKPYKHGD